MYSQLHRCNRTHHSFFTAHAVAVPTLITLERRAVAMKRQKFIPSIESCAKRQKLEPCCTSLPMLLKEAGLAQSQLVCRGYSRGPASSPSTSGRTSVAAPIAQASESKEGLWMIVGLGNPGSNYERTRHNVGFMVIDELARTESIDCRKLEKSAAVGRGEIGGRQVLLVKPVTFMNNSGESVSALARFYKVPPSRILVVSDDLDQPTASIKLKQRGGHGGHNGLRSIIERMSNSQDFPRLKIGIGRPAGELPVASYVLQDFNKKEREVIDVAVAQSADIVRSVLVLGLEKALSGVRA
ncbi:hypothetical protein CEUSTIGMA_g10052.t1 [Chlamydomonas eustigma]|uniref:peptidyl-tRNA hydrolase n=1 Tax=Chlamydomonas eustigma TaxID=1157962 RepID=A0A250XHZ9_9CHLO|nr:hypothetical protein CEUSTIGMA_g10052.t1 [Chlamydomonas eustigma]|eukprot:GAX82626.1 hypothetical protein CEUSTIGMA_g10052.t1 [Chlamydomonas eustigma]